ncbi:MAG: hypothetical protein K0R54_5874 [Clostridiaceae bacterium]|jgi:hypothetical protein|nr:hypothetical protein [Clostridiaceae bacterium]
MTKNNTAKILKVEDIKKRKYLEKKKLKNRKIKQIKKENKKIKF